MDFLFLEGKGVGFDLGVKKKNHVKKGREMCNLDVNMRDYSIVQLAIHAIECTNDRDSICYC